MADLTRLPAPDSPAQAEAKRLQRRESIQAMQVSRSVAVPLFIWEMAEKMAEREGMTRDLLIRRAIVTYDFVTKGGHKIVEVSDKVWAEVDTLAAARPMPTITLAGELIVSALRLLAQQPTGPAPAEALAAENQRLRAALGGIEAEAIVQYMSASNQGSAAETIVRIARAALVNAELPGGQKVL